ncbi:MAG: Cna B-type domain-containing protein [Oscillospiraceae bacterium]|jgi:LPXTG-motif cell wall-anchored protein|nr:Cna B-type domain-containing protein [Oscillospiraceae bacterium]
MGIKKQQKRLFVTLALPVLSLFLALIVVIQPALAWSGSKLHKTSVLSARRSYATVELIKRSLNLQGEAGGRVAGAEFYLFQKTPQGDVQIGSRMVTDAQGLVRAPRLTEPGEYFFLEAAPAYGYDYLQNGEGDPVNAYPFAVPQEMNPLQPIFVEAFNYHLEGAITVTKELQNSDQSPLTPEQLALDFAFKAEFSQPGSYVFSVDGATAQALPADGRFCLKHGQTAQFTNIPIGTEYTVTEEPPEGYAVASENHHGVLTFEGVAAKFTNTWQVIPPDPTPDPPPPEWPDPTPDPTPPDPPPPLPPPPETWLTVHKSVLGDVPESERDRQFRFTVTINGTPQTILLRAGETSEKFALPFGAVWDIREDDLLAEGWASAGLLFGSGIALGLPVMAMQFNRYIGVPTIEIKGEKTWDRSADPKAALPDAITILLKHGALVVEEQTVKPDEEGRWRYSFTAPERDKAGNVIEYHVEEVPVENYSAKADGWNIINTYVPPPENPPGSEPGTPDNEVFSPSRNPKTGDSAALPLSAFCVMLLATAGAWLSRKKRE